MPASVGRQKFVEKFGLLCDEDVIRARAVVTDAETANIDYVRFAWVDQNGVVRGKTIAARLLGAAFENGIDFPVAPLFFDTANAIVYNPFELGGGFGMAEMQGDPNVVLIPDPHTFKVLPWAPHIGWILCDMYFPSGTPVPFSTRQIYRELVDSAAGQGFEFVAGLEVEWYLTKVIDPRLGTGDLGGPADPAPAPKVMAVSHGFQYLLEDHTDEIDDVLHPLYRYLAEVGLPIRSLENEWGPGQVEFTFDPLFGMAAADAMILLRVATRQICRRLGYHASFMCKPAFESFYSSGWHLHQSIADINEGSNLFPSNDEKPLSELGIHYVGGLVRHGREGSVFTTHTVNGYRRLKPNSLAPIQASWAVDNRGAMVRVQGRSGDVGSHIENRIGEPAANPYLYLGSQLAAGLDGIKNTADPGPLLDEPYEQQLGDPLPTSLEEAVSCLNSSQFFRDTFGDQFIDYYVRMKQSEVDRFNAYVAGQTDSADGVTDWEQREYFRLY
jgi:glutamine synthetase